MKMTVTSAQRTFTATLKTILPYNLFLLYLYLYETKATRQRFVETVNREEYRTCQFRERGQSVRPESSR